MKIKILSIMLLLLLGLSQVSYAGSCCGCSSSDDGKTTTEAGTEAPGTKSN